jgi:hypothetical protein
MKHSVLRAALTLLAAVLLGVSVSEAKASQKPNRVSTASRKARIQLRNIDQFKEAFQNDAGKIRLVALVSPT